LWSLCLRQGGQFCIARIHELAPLERRASSHPGNFRFGHTSLGALVMARLMPSHFSTMGKWRPYGRPNTITDPNLRSRVFTPNVSPRPNSGQDASLILSLILLAGALTAFSACDLPAPITPLGVGGFVPGGQIYKSELNKGLTRETGFLLRAVVASPLTNRARPPVFPGGSRWSPSHT